MSRIENVDEALKQERTVTGSLALMVQDLRDKIADGANAAQIDTELARYQTPERIKAFVAMTSAVGESLDRSVPGRESHKPADDASAGAPTKGGSR